MNTLAVVFMVWAIIATAFLVTQREWGLSMRRLWLDERRTRRQFQKFAKDERLLRLWAEAQLVDQIATATVWRTMWIRAAAGELKRSAETNGHLLELLREDDPA